MNITKYILTITYLIFLAACGGGSDSTGTVATVAKTTMNLTVVLNGSNASQVKGIQATITLPDGVIVKAGSDGQITDGVIIPSNTTPDGLIVGKCIAAEKKVSIVFETTKDMVAGDLATITLDLNAGTTAPAATAFEIISSKLVGGSEVDVVPDTWLSLR